MPETVPYQERLRVRNIALTETVFFQKDSQAPNFARPTSH